MAEFGGRLPADPEALATIEGIGPYTLGAILSFAFHQKAAAVDGNVMRVLSRFWGIEAPIDLPATQKEIRIRAQNLLPEEKPWEISEALIELGALVCGKTPKCPICPLRKECVAKKKNLQLPNKRKKIKTTHLYRAVGLIEASGEFLVGQVAKGQVMEGLWEFPFVEKEECLETFLGIKLKFHQEYPKETHTFTRFKAHLFPTHWHAQKKMVTPYLWKTLEEMVKLPFSSGHRRILQQLYHSTY
ncbi:MAG: NUDIX domain-containing protein [Candidatus Algichlamydia australiensis]|nr:NUDIX domain-containing protein [Chlamydiales bacterium]